MQRLSPTVVLLYFSSFVALVGRSRQTETLRGLTVWREGRGVPPLFLLLLPSCQMVVGQSHYFSGACFVAAAAAVVFGNTVQSDTFPSLLFHPSSSSSFFFITVSVRIPFLFEERLKHFCCSFVSAGLVWPSAFFFSFLKFVSLRSCRTAVDSCSVGLSRASPNTPSQCWTFRREQQSSGDSRAA